MATASNTTTIGIGSQSNAIRDKHQRLRDRREARSRLIQAAKARRAARTSNEGGAQ
jgi:hypothetical protein